MVWIETPTNPSLKIVDIKAVVDLVRKTNPNTIVVVDSTVATPLYQRPLKLGADIVLHSLTKFINGHLDVVMGSLMLNREDLFRKILKLQDS
jgi:cystathionine beta-lyase/cystathionine gamma-synthase